MEKNNIIVNTCSSSSYQISSDLHPLKLLPSGPGVTSNSSGRGHHHHRKKRRTKFTRNNNNNNTTSQLVMIPNPKPTRKPDPDAPKITRPCTECGRKFWSWKALFGHMRCHPEREWRGIVPPPKFRRPEITYDDDNSSSITEEDHEVAACLLMLANGPPPAASSDNTVIACTEVNQLGGRTPEYSDDDQNNNMAVMIINNNCGGFECSSCKKVFGSHQALGGHRASHKNVKGCYAITAKTTIIHEVADHGEEELIDHQIQGFCSSAGDYSNTNQMIIMSSSSSTKQQEIINTNMTKNGLMGHKCSICFRVFSSGQALGGHMRCHWEKDDNVVAMEMEMEEEPIISRVLGGFDLNLAAPPPLVVDDQDDTDFAAYSPAALDLRLGI